MPKRNDSTFQIRLPEKLKTDFVEIAEAQNYSAAEVVRAFMLDYVSHYKEAQHEQR